ncbi:MAG: hypothetical protein U9O85_06900 [Euryarchaeota archaeon]|nr:hypothetical protein [Euryarchaeota archaeon]
MKLFNKIFSKWVLKKIENAVSIDESKSKHPQLEEVSRRSIHDTVLRYDKVKFRLYIDSKATIPISVKSINCIFTYNGVMIQNMTVEDGDIFATNGAEVNLVTIEAQESDYQICPFNPFPYIPVLPESNEGWGIKGSIKFRCFYGTFEKKIKNIEMSIGSPKRWEESRSKYQQLYTSVFGNAVSAV